MNRLIDCFKALGDETRFRIFYIISRRRICVKGLAMMLAVSESAVSQHLKVLRDTGLIRGERRGHYMHYHVKDPDVVGLVIRLQQHFDREADLEQLIPLIEARGVCHQVCDHEGDGCIR